MESVTLASDFDDDQFTLQILNDIDALRDEVHVYLYLFVKICRP